MLHQQKTCRDVKSVRIESGVVKGIKWRHDVHAGLHMQLPNFDAHARTNAQTQLFQVGTYRGAQTISKVKITSAAPKTDVIPQNRVQTRKIKGSIEAMMNGCCI